MVTDHTIASAIEVLGKLKIEHRNYRLVKRRLSAACRAAFRGELLVLVGPTRVGKTRCVRDALAVPTTNLPDDNGHMRVVLVEAANESTSGEFSTKSFAMACLRAIHHPIYGVAAEDDPWERGLDELLDRTPERRLWSAFANALRLRKTEYLVIDEAHHVLYVRGGDMAASRVLESWKCLANTTQIKIVLIGSYSVLSLLTLAPHLLGRQQPLEFPRYRSDSRTDIEAWEQLLRRFSEHLPIENGKSLSVWNRYLFEGSIGRAGGLSMWLRSALAHVEAAGLSSIAHDALQETRLPRTQEGAILAEITEGERHLLRRKEPAPEPPRQPDPRASVERKGIPFRRKPKRNPVSGRA